MLATTPRGDAYTFAEFRSMVKDAGFKEPEFQPLPASVNQVVMAAK
jgi:hypothetical protein